MLCSLFILCISGTLIVHPEMDKSWIQCNPLSPEYENGVEEFINFTTKNTEGNGVIRCQCLDCGNLPFETLIIVKDHLYMCGFDVKYDIWF